MLCKSASVIWREKRTVSRTESIVDIDGFMLFLKESVVNSLQTRGQEL